MRHLGLVVGLTVLTVGLAPFVGPSMDHDAGSFVLWQLRVPRVALATVVGATLGLVGAAFQALFDNDLATPATVGTTAGASLGALAALVLLPVSLTTLTPAVTAAAFAGALVATFGVMAVAASGRARTEDVLLAGVGLTFAASALAAGLQATADMATTFQAVRWSLGSVATVGPARALQVLPFALVAHAVLFRQIRALEAMAQGADRAATQGVDVVRTRTWVLGAGALGVGAVTAWCGPIAFVGLVVPHIVRRTLGASRPLLLPASSLIGASYLVAADALARVVLPGRELPVGVLTAAIGGPMLLWLVSRQRR